MKAKRVMLLRLSPNSTHYEYLGDRANGLIGTVAVEGDYRLDDSDSLANPFIVPDPLCAGILGVKEYLDHCDWHRGIRIPIAVSMLGEYKLLDQEE